MRVILSFARRKASFWLQRSSICAWHREKYERKQEYNKKPVLYACQSRITPVAQAGHASYGGFTILPVQQDTV